MLKFSELSCVLEVGPNNMKFTVIARSTQHMEFVPKTLNWIVITFLCSSRKVPFNDLLSSAPYYGEKSRWYQCIQFDGSRLTICKDNWIRYINGNAFYYSALKIKASKRQSALPAALCTKETKTQPQTNRRKCKLGTERASSLQFEIQIYTYTI